MTKIKTFNEAPTKDFIIREKIFGTKAIQDKKTGRMKGRKKVKGRGDGVPIQRVKKPFYTKVKKSKRARGHIRRLHKKGQIFGRGKKI